MGFVIVLLVVFIFLLFLVVALLAGGGILFVLYETFTDPVFISFLVVVIVGGGFLVIRAVKADSKYLDETATLFASKDNETDRRKVVRAYLLKRNQVERAFSTRKPPPREISFEEARAILEVRAEELEKERSGKGPNDEAGKYDHEWPEGIKR